MWSSRVMRYASPMLEKGSTVTKLLCTYCRALKCESLSQKRHSTKSLSTKITDFSVTFQNTDLLVDKKVIQKYVNSVVGEYKQILETLQNESTTGSKVDLKTVQQKLMHLQPIVECAQDIQNLNLEIQELQQLVTDSTVDRELLELARRDTKRCKSTIKLLEQKLQNLILPPEPLDLTDVILEVTAGVGGLEAMLFAQELFDMYIRYARWKGWQCEIMEQQFSDLDGLRHGSLWISGPDAYAYLKFEGGVHRVQRVPKTEKSGRIHTSTAAVAILLQPADIEVNLNPKDIKFETKRSSGAGGQHVNKTDSAVRLTHIPTGIVVECQKARSQIQNRADAMKMLQAKLYQIQYEKQLNEQQSSRKIQIGTSGRSEKIRTYNFTQDRITDHRLEEHVHNLEEFLKGAEALDVIIQMLCKELKKEIFMETIQKP